MGNNIVVTVTGYTLGGLDAGNYTVSQPAGLAANITPLVNIPSITLTGSISIFNSCATKESTAQSFTVNGSNLLTNVTVSAPVGFELSTSASGSYTNSLVLNITSGTLSNTTIFIRLNTAITGNLSGNIVASSTGASDQSISVTGLVSALPVVSAITGIQQLCFQSTTQFMSATDGGTWRSSNTTVATVNSSGVINGMQLGNAIISYTVTSPFGCETTVNRAITVNPLPNVTVTASPTVVLKGQNTQLNATVIGDVPSFAWSPAANIVNPTQASTLARVTQNTTYTLTATSAQGCVRTSSVTVTVKEDEIFVEPINVFTPNGDGVNDRFIINNIDQYPDNKLQLYDRAGKLIFEQKNYANTWDGTIGGKVLIKDTYFYIITIQGKIVKKGAITLVR